MTRLEQINSLSWQWNNKPLKLLEAHPKQLQVIEHALKTGTRDKWFGQPIKTWTDAIKDIKSATKVVDGVLTKLKLVY